MWDLGQVAWPLWFSVSSSGNANKSIYLTELLWGLSWYTSRGWCSIWHKCSYYWWACAQQGEGHCWVLRLNWLGVWLVPGFASDSGCPRLGVLEAGLETMIHMKVIYQRRSQKHPVGGRNVGLGREGSECGHGIRQSGFCLCSGT